MRSALKKCRPKKRYKHLPGETLHEKKPNRTTINAMLESRKLPGTHAMPGHIFLRRLIRGMKNKSDHEAL